jgi:hypothetical protein
MKHESHRTTIFMDAEVIRVVWSLDTAIATSETARSNSGLARCYGERVAYLEKKVQSPPLLVCAQTRSGEAEPVYLPHIPS